VTDTRREYSDLAATYLPIAVAVAAIVVLVFIVVLWRFRAGRPGRPDRRMESTVLELGYIVVLAAIAVFLVTRTFSVESRVDAAARAPALRVDVTAAKWEWRFAYPGLGVARDGELVVPAGREVQFSGRSIDVIHDFWVPRLRYQHQVFPQGVEHWKLVFPRPGGYGGRCSWFCGLRHQDMDFAVRALAPDEFAAWVRRVRASA
jgi:cytochrome c oxidase subunit 2